MTCGGVLGTKSLGATRMRSANRPGPAFVGSPIGMAMATMGLGDEKLTMAPGRADASKRRSTPRFHSDEVCP